LHLMRRNYLANYVSGRIALELVPGFGRANFTCVDDIRRIDRTVWIDPTTIVVELNKIRQRIANARRTFSVCKHLKECYYEDLTYDPRQVCRSITDFLHVKLQHPLHSRYVKIGEHVISKSIRNVDEVRQALANTAYSALLDEVHPT
jgi:hypothetical protein